MATKNFTTEGTLTVSETEAPAKRVPYMSVASNLNAAGKAQNRRVEIVILPNA